jgi:hypothetical protein
MLIEDGGQVGIGTTSPGYKLHVNGNFSASTVNTGPGNYELYAMNQNVRTTDNVTFATVNTGYGNNELWDMNQNVLTSSNVTFNRVAISDYGYALGGFHVGGSSDPGTDHLIVDGNVGIGVTPADKLDVNGDIRVRGADIKDTGGTSRITLTDNGNLHLREDGGTASLTVDTQGDVGIGITSPGYKLQVVGSFSATTVNTGPGNYELYAMNQNVRTTDNVTFATVNTGYGNNELWDMNQNVRTTDYVDFADLYISRATSGRLLDVYATTADQTTQTVNFQRSQDPFGANDILQIYTPSTSPNNFQFIECERGTDAEFKVNGDGNVYADGSYTGPADFSEMIAVSSGASTVEPGDVMVIDPNNPRAILKASGPRSTLVAGIYSTKPGFLGSERDWDKPTVREDEGADTYTLEDMASEFNEIPLAVVGITPCKVSTENGPIHPGDLLVTSSTPGHAMRDDNPKVGTVLGKALGSLSSGTGVIKVLVTLH